MDAEFLSAFTEAFKHNKVDELADSLRGQKDTLATELEAICTENYAAFIATFDQLYQLKPMLQTLATSNDEVNRATSALQIECTKLVKSLFNWLVELATPIAGTS